MISKESFLFLQFRLLCYRVLLHADHAKNPIFYFLTNGK
jgi:hypothetical protein